MGVRVRVEDLGWRNERYANDLGEVKGRHYVPPLALFFHERRKVYVQYMFVDYVLNHHNAYLSNLLTAQMIQSDYLKVTDSLEKIQKCFFV